MSGLLERLKRTPMAITEEGFQMVLEVVTRTTGVTAEEAKEIGRARRAEDEARVEAILRAGGRRVDAGSRRATIIDGVGLIPVTGPIFRHANLLTDISGATSTEMLTKDIAAVEAAGARRIVFDFDTPGGEAMGIAEAAEVIHNLSVPTTAHISGFGASAGYWLAAAADEVVIAPNGAAGSIGVRMTLRTRDEPKGVASYEFVSSQSPRKSVDLESDEGQAQMQRFVDQQAEPFIAAVARYRGVPEATVLAEFGAGDMFTGQHAVDAGLADRVGTLEGVMSGTDSAQAEAGTAVAMHVQATDGLGNQIALPVMTVGSSTGWTSHPTNASGESAAVAPESPTEGDKPMSGESKTPTIDRAYLDANHPDLVASIKAEEAERVARINALHAPGLEELRAELAADPSVSVGDAAVRINAAHAARDQQAGQAHLDGVKAAEEKLDVPAASSAEGAEQMTEEDAEVAATLALGRETGHVRKAS